MLIISAHLLLFANLVVEEKIVVVENKPSINISKINLQNVVIKKPKPKPEPIVEKVIEKPLEIIKPLPKTKSENIPLGYFSSVALIPLRGKPIIWWQLENLKKQGIN